MNSKTFYATSFTEAMESIRGALGPDAMILSTRHLKEGESSVFLNGNPARVEVVAALEGQVAAQEESQRPPSPTSTKKTKPEAPRFNPDLRKKNVWLRENSELQARQKLMQKQQAPKEKTVERPRIFGVQEGASTSGNSAAAKSQRKALLKKAVQPSPEERLRPNRKTGNSPSPLSELSRLAAQKPKAKPAPTSAPEKTASKAAPKMQAWTPEKDDGERLMTARGVNAARVIRPDGTSAGPSLRSPSAERTRQQKQQATTRAIPSAYRDEAAPTGDKEKAPKVFRSLLRELRALSEELDRNGAARVENEKPVGTDRLDKKTLDKGPAAVAREATSQMGEIRRPLQGREISLGCFDAEGARISQAEPLTASRVQRRFLAQGVEKNLTDRIVHRLFFAARGVQSNAPFEGPEIEPDLGQLSHVVEGFVPAAKREEPGPVKLALVGPTGVGKTTTIAKIASLYALKQDKKVALVTLDTWRVAATDQLKTYARLLGVPIEIVTDGKTLDDAFARFSGMDVVLIDTPGYSPGDSKALEKMAKRLKRDDVDVHLVLPASLRDAEMERVRKIYSAFAYSHLVFSKLDEAAHWGNVLNAWVLGADPVSWFTTGQRVPEDLQAPSAAWLCDSILEDRLAPSAL